MTGISTGAARASLGRRRDHAVARLLRRPDAVVAALVLLVIVVIGVLAPAIAPHDPDRVVLRITLSGPTAGYPLGGDSSGRDVLSRLLLGTTTTLVGALVAIVTAVVVGMPVGVVAGYRQGALDRVAGWLSDALQSIPGIIVLLVVGSAVQGNITLIMIVVGLFMAPGFFRITRSVVLSVRAEPYVDAAKVAGLSDARIMLRHIVRSVTAPVVIQATLVTGFAIGMQSGLQFLGVGDPRASSWGQMMNDGFRNVTQAPLLLLWPSLALGVTIAALAVLGSALGDVLGAKASVDLVVFRRRGGMRAEAPADSPTGGTTMPPADAAVSLRGLRVSYATSRRERTEVVHGVGFDVAPGEVLGIVGESGSGKSQSVFSVLDLLPSNGRAEVDELWIGGTDVSDWSPKRRHALLGRTLGYVPQEPMSNLDPCYTVAQQLTEPLRAATKVSRREARTRAAEALARVGIVDVERTLRSYPHQLSGGMAQRVLIAGAVIGRPSVLVADEPTTALDVTVQAEVLELLRELQREGGMALVIVTHNFGVVADICDRVVVMQHGNVVEQGTVAELFAAPQHPHTQELIRASLDEAETRADLDAAFAAAPEGGR